MSATLAGNRLIQLQRRPRRRRRGGGAEPPGKGPHWAWRYAAAAALVLAAMFIDSLMPELMGRRLPFFTFFPVVALSGFIGGLGPGLLATALSALAAAHLEFPPYGGLLIARPSDRLRLTLFLLVGSFLSYLNHVLHDAVRRARRAEEEAARERDLQTLVTDAMPALVSYVDWEHRYVFGNAAYRDWFGASSVAGRRMPEVLGRDAYESLRPYLDEAFAGRLVRFSERVPYRSGARWVQALYTPDRAPDGSVRGVVALVLDVSDRRAAEAARQESERKYRTLFETMDEGFCIVEVLFDEAGAANDYRLLEVNPAFERQTGLKDAAGHTIRELSPEHEEYWFEIYGRVALTGEPARFERGAVQLGRWYEVHAWRFGNPEARQVAILFKDVRERRRAEEAIRRGEQQLRTIIDEMNMLISYIGKDERYVFNNRRYKDWLGRSPEELKGRHVRELAGDRYDEVRPHIRRALAGEEVSFELEGTVNGRKRILRVEYVPDRAPDGSVGGIYSFVTDVTDVRLRSEELQKAVHARTEELRRTVADLEAFSYTVSHDLRAPLRAIQGYASIIAKQAGGALGEEASRLLERISQSTTRMDRLIQDLLVFGRLSRGDYKMYPLDLEPVVDHIIAQYPGFDKASITVRRPLGRVIGQDSLLTQVMSNLLGNALKFVPRGRRPAIEVRAERAGGRARVFVEDNGLGIEPEYRARLFRPFSRLQSADEYEGTGIGLAIVKKAAERMGGSVGVESEPGKGSRFWIELPDGGA